MNNISLSFKYPWLLLVIIPLLLLTFYPYFRLPKKHRMTRNRITSIVIHVFIVSFLTLVLSGVRIHNNYVSQKSDVIILVDQSKSFEQHSDQIDEFINEVINEMPDKYRIGFVGFANDSHYIARLNSNTKNAYEQYLKSPKRPDVSATNISQGLIYAQQQLDTPKKGRIILISDGRQTDANAILTAKQLADSGTRVDVKYMTPKLYDNDAEIIEVMMPDHITRGIETSIEVLINSYTEGEAKLNITYQSFEGNITDTQEVTLKRGTQSFVFNHIFTNLGLNEIVVSLTADETVDKIIENNTYHTFAHLTDTTSQGLLIIEGVSGEGNELKDILETNGYEVTITTINQLPTSVEALTTYQEVILVNVKNSDLIKSGFQNILNNYVRNYGGGLLTIGGDRAYQQQDMSGDGVDRTFSELLPVDSNTDPKAMAVVIVMDASGSMTANASTKFALAKAGAKASVKALLDSRGDTTHMFGLVTFNTNLQDVIPLTNVTNIDSINARIDALTTNTGTQYSKGLQEAQRMLNNAQYSHMQKHIIFLTDGGAQDSEVSYTAILNGLTDISVSTIALGREGENDLNPEKVEAMVRVYNNRGRYYRVEQQSELESVMRIDTEQAHAGDFVNESPFIGQFITQSPAFIGLSQIPELDGYYGTRAKSGSTIIAKTDKDDPLYVEWTPEGSKGRVGSFMTDLNGFENGFSKSFINDYFGIQFVKSMVKSVLPQTEVINNQNIQVTYTEVNFETNIRVRLSLRDDETLRVTVTSPDGKQTRLSMSAVARTIYQGTFIKNIPGTYTVEVSKYNKNNRVVGSSTSYTAFSYSNEFKNSFSEQETIVLMEGISKAGSGTYLNDVRDMFTKEAETVSQNINPMMFFMITSLILFLLDIIVRKFKFKWPHEFFKKKQEIH